MVAPTYSPESPSTQKRTAPESSWKKGAGGMALSVGTFIAAA
jgi:hypothetical protein